MPPKVTKNSLYARLGKTLAKAHEAHKGDTTTFAARGELPAGINNGVAELVDIHIGQYESGDFEGKDFIYFGSVVLAPQNHDGVPIEGLRASVIEPLCDTPDKSRKTFDEHWAWVLTLLRTSFGVDTDTIDPENLEEFFEALVEEAPKHRFRTWSSKPTKAYPNPRTNTDFGAAVVYNASEDDDVAEDDDSPEDETPEDDEEAGDDEETEESDEEEESDDEEVDLKALAKAAQADDEDAQHKLEELAEAAGVPAKKVENAKKWADVVKMIEAAQEEAGDDEEEESDEESEEADESEDEDSEEEESEDSTPEVGNVYMFKAPGAKKAVEVEVTKVNAKAETATVKDLNTDKVIVGKDKKPLAVKFADLAEQD